jgi:hypothetical protein
MYHDKIRRAHERRRAWAVLRDSATVRRLAMTSAGVPPELSRLFAENDHAYYRRRFVQERTAARNAVSPKARKAHEELAERYARVLSRPRRSKPRQDALLDEALKATFPASDP